MFCLNLIWKIVVVRKKKNVESIDVSDQLIFYLMTKNYGKKKKKKKKTKKKQHTTDNSIS